MIQRHILGIQPLLSPYKILAADVNNSKSITVADLSVLRKVLLGITTTFDNNTSWRFVPENYVLRISTNLIILMNISILIHYLKIRIM